MVLDVSIDYWGLVIVLGVSNGSLGLVIVLVLSQLRMGQLLEGIEWDFI